MARGNRESSFCGRGQGSPQDRAADFFFHVQHDHILSVGGYEDVFAGGCASLGQDLEANAVTFIEFPFIHVIPMDCMPENRMQLLCFPLHLLLFFSFSSFLLSQVNN